MGHSFPCQIRMSNRISDQSFASTCIGKQGDIEVAVNKLTWKAMFEQINDVVGKFAGNTLTWQAIIEQLEEIAGNRDLAGKLDWTIGQSDLTGLRLVVQSQVQHELTFHKIFCHRF